MRPPKPGLRGKVGTFAHFLLWQARLVPSKYAIVRDGLWRSNHNKMRQDKEIPCLKR